MITLQEAIRIIAEYDGWKSKYRGLQLVFTKDGYMRFEDEIKYSTSSDALLPVLRKAFKEKWGEDDMDSIWDSEFGGIGGLIVWNKLEQACIELATIIQQLNEKK
jgi:hypothetical protein